ncbi:phage integrase family protein [Burkholderia sp. AU45388]|uniref:phage integrase family protein n=1 Tax=Burkholderia sp. AU45388 TaxID=3059206 RepID=UPI002655D34C|nr:phage integrase family protein [Burkholderia sp. AU45388]MDN7429065.1 phage integrase family protein [Burkholderia sp. AU45388]
MADRPQPIAHQRTYTRNDFTALRAFVQRVPPATVGRLYFGEDENGHTPSPAATKRRLRDMQVDLALEHDSASLSAVSLKMVEQAAQLAVARPEAQHAVGMWFRPLVAKRLKVRQIHTLGELVVFCNARGGSWWRAVPRIGTGRARHLVT